MLWGMRHKGSARFESYFKVQVWEPRSLAWRDVQRSFGSAAEARSAFPAGEECRVMEVSESGRRPV